jgi:hypothetical protein
MMGMVGKRLAAAGIFAAAVAAAALWVAPHPSHGTLSRMVRQAQSATVTAQIPHVSATVGQSLQSVAHSITGVTAVGIVLFGLALFGLASRQPRQPAPVLARPARRGRAPPSPRGAQRTARTHCRWPSRD